MKSNLLKLGLVSLVAGATGALMACQNSSSSNGTANGSVPAGTPQLYPVPALAFYASSAFNGQVDESLYFGNRVALLFYMGNGPVGGRDANGECVGIANGQSRDYSIIGYSGIGGYQKTWQPAGTRRYSEIQVQEGQAIGMVNSWKVPSRKNTLTSLQGGSYLVCVRDRRNRGPNDAMGFYFQANGQMDQMVNVNMNFSNQRYGFSETYYGKTFNRKPMANPNRGERIVPSVPPAGRSQVGQRGVPMPR